MEAGLSLRPSRWWWIVLVFLSIGLFDATQTVLSMKAQGMHHNWTQLFAALLFSWLPWALATPLIAILGRRYPPVHLRPPATWFVHLSVCAFIGLVASGWNAALESLLNPWAKSPGPDPLRVLWFRNFDASLLLFLILYSTILAISYVLDSRERLAMQQAETARLNEQLSKAQLDALRRQIEPHFLFNTLNAIAGLVREQRTDDAIGMIAGLSDILRRVLRDSGKQQVSLGEEMDFVHKYLDIQNVRFAERLRVRINVPTDLLRAQVPSFILQPMVENAIKHGIGKRAQGGDLRITAARSNGMLTLRVYNDGPGLSAEWEKQATGVGISNTRTRLQGLYGKSFDLNMRNQGTEGVEVSVSFPFKES